MAEEENKVLIKDLDGFRAVMYMLFSLEAKMKVHTELMIEFAEILTQKDPGEIKTEVYTKMVKELRTVREKFVEDDDLLHMINTIKL